MINQRNCISGCGSSYSAPRWALLQLSLALIKRRQPGRLPGPDNADELDRLPCLVRCGCVRAQLCISSQRSMRRRSGRGSCRLKIASETNMKAIRLPSGPLGAGSGVSPSRYSLTSQLNCQEMAAAAAATTIATATATATGNK